ncbi:MAG: hypothetical protein J6040_02700 [Clostridiales bacterium]|nr:hypothetical protein [Clostridiales bacterium]
MKQTEAFRGIRQIKKMKDSLIVGKVYKIKIKSYEGKTPEWRREPAILMGLFENYASFRMVKGGYRESRNYQDLYIQRNTL